MKIRVLTFIIMLLGYAICGFPRLASPDSRGLSIAQLKERGDMYLEEDMPDSAIFFYNSAIDKYSESLPVADKKKIADALINCGYVYSFCLSDVSTAYRQYQRAEDISLSTGDTSILPYVYLNKGAIYANYNDSAKVMHFYRKAFDTSIKEKEWDIAIASMTNIMQMIDCYEQREQMLPILRTFSNLDIPNVEMLPYTRKMEQAAYLMTEKKWDAAIDTIQQAIKLINLKISPERYVITCNQVIAQIYLKKHDYANAITLFREILDAATRLSAYDCMNDGLTGLRRSYSALGDKEMTAYYKTRQMELWDSLYNSKSFTTISDIEANNEVSKIEVRVARLEYEKRQQNILTVVAIVGALVVFVMLMVIVKKNRKLHLQNRVLFEKNEALMQAETKGQTVRTLTQRHDSKSVELLERIEAVMADIDTITREDFSLAVLAELTDSKERYVSQVINDMKQKTFSVWLSELRVMEACRRFKNMEEYGNLSMEGIAQNLGYKSRSHFTTVFKRQTGLSPTEYLAQAKSEN